MTTPKHRFDNVLQNFDKAFPYLLSTILIAAFIGITMVAFKSPDTIHPDEFQTEPAVLYYIDHNLPPDVRDLDISYFSGYGMTRLWELNLYYFLAGKTALLTNVSYNFRLFSVLLSLILVSTAIKHCKKNLFLTLAFVLTPQLWYLFSYATSDAFDYFLSFFCLQQVICSDSSLQKLLHREKGQLKPYHFLIPGLLFGLMLMAKKNFYLIPLWIGCYLFYELVFAAKEKRTLLLKRYALVLSLALGVLFLRCAVDYPIYGLEKSEIVDEVIEENSLYEYKPSTPANERAASVTLYEKGVSLKTLLTEMDFHTLLFQSFSGLYGAYAIGTNPLYYMVYGILFVGLLLFGGYRFYSCRPTLCQKLKYVTSLFLMVLSYALVIYNAYFIDFQPQGRYLFPGLIVFIYTLSLPKDFQQSRLFKLLVLALSLLSLVSFLWIGVRQMI